MACIKWQKPDGREYWVLENVQHVPTPGSINTGVVDWACNERSTDNLRDVFTEDGFMLGNAVKKVTTALGIKQCLACAGRQRRFNQWGIEIQQKVKSLL